MECQHPHLWRRLASALSTQNGGSSSGPQAMIVPITCHLRILPLKQPGMDPEIFCKPRTCSVKLLCYTEPESGFGFV